MSQVVDWTIGRPVDDTFLGEKGLKEGVVELIHAFESLLKKPLSSQQELLALPLQELRARAEELTQVTRNLG
jgi:hypothetical protein